MKLFTTNSTKAAGTMKLVSTTDLADYTDYLVVLLTLLNVVALKFLYHA